MSRFDLFEISFFRVPSVALFFGRILSLWFTAADKFYRRWLSCKSRAPDSTGLDGTDRATFMSLIL